MRRRLQLGARFPLPCSRALTPTDAPSTDAQALEKQEAVVSPSGLSYKDIKIGKGAPDEGITHAGAGPSTGGSVEAPSPPGGRRAQPSAGLPDRGGLRGYDARPARV